MRDVATRKVCLYWVCNTWCSLNVTELGPGLGAEPVGPIEADDGPCRLRRRASLPCIKAFPAGEATVALPATASVFHRVQLDGTSTFRCPRMHRRHLLR
jgi:hypothetical protein